jgi:hypothetical protein
MADIPVEVKPAHKELERLLKRLEMVKVSAAKPAKPERTTETPEQWVDALRAAKDAIEEWCSSFTIPLPAKDE